MKEIIQHFLGEVISLEEKTLNNLGEEYFLEDFTDKLNEKVMELSQEIVKNMLGKIEEEIYKSKERKKKYISYQKDSKANERKIITIFGEIVIKRRYYQRVNSKEKEYLLDKIIGLEENERMLKNVEEKLLEVARVKSYEYAGKQAAYGVTISKETVKNKIQELNFKVIPKERYDKEKKKRIYIQADEDHVHLQEGGIVMPRLITVYEDNIKGRLVGARRFGGVYNENIDELWEEVYSYVEEKYDYDYIEEVFIMGDGANWIKTGLEWLPKSKYIADRFHINKAIIAMTGNNKEKIKEIKEAMYEFDYKKVKEIGYEVLAEEMNSKKRKRKEEQLEYLINNKEGFKNSILYDTPGCSAEGDISHTYSDRLSSRPLGWSKESVDKIARLRILALNGKNIKIITRNKEENKERIEKQKEVKKLIKNKNYIRDIGYSYTIPEIVYGEHEIRQKIKEIISNKAI